MGVDLLEEPRATTAQTNQMYTHPAVNTDEATVSKIGLCSDRGEGVINSFAQVVGIAPHLPMFSGVDHERPDSDAEYDMSLIERVDRSREAHDASCPTAQLIDDTLGNNSEEGGEWVDLSTIQLDVPVEGEAVRSFTNEGEMMEPGRKELCLLS